MTLLQGSRGVHSYVFTNVFYAEGICYQSEANWKRLVEL